MSTDEGKNTNMLGLVKQCIRPLTLYSYRDMHFFGGMVKTSALLHYISLRSIKKSKYK